jgi:SAF domain
MTPPASPAARRLATPSWLDARFVFGLLLVLVSVVVGARVLAGADRSDRVYAATRNIAAGTALTAPDLRVIRVRLLDDRAGYVSADGPKPVGYVLDRAIGADEFLPRQALHSGPAVDVRLVTVPVVSNHYPARLQHGDLVDLYRTAKSPAGAPPTAPTLTLGRVSVEAVNGANPGRLATAVDAGIVLRVPVPDVPRVVAAAQGGALDILGIPPSAPAQPPAAAQP